MVCSRDMCSGSSGYITWSLDTGTMELVSVTSCWGWPVITASGGWLMLIPSPSTSLTHSFMIRLLLQSQLTTFWSWQVWCAGLIWTASYLWATSRQTWRWYWQDWKAFHYQRGELSPDMCSVVCYVSAVSGDGEVMACSGASWRPLTPSHCHCHVTLSHRSYHLWPPIGHLLSDPLGWLVLISWPGGGEC